jgi:alginate biosynthesis protein AlgX
MKLRIFLPSLVISVLYTSVALAQEQCGMEETQYLFCPAMKDEALYDKNGFDSYRLLVPGKAGWIFRSESDFRSDFSIPDETLDDIEELSDAFRAHGTKLILLITPTRGLVHSQYIADDDKEKYGLTNIDKTWKDYWKGIASIRARGVEVVGVERPKPEMPFFYRKDHHWNPYGAQQAAKALTARIKNMPEYKDIPKVEYVTHEAGTYDFFGVSKKVFKRLCDTRQPPERIIKKITERKEAANAEADLFGDTAAPEIVLLGTSNSTMEPSQANFEGFLNEELSADIQNMSVSGGGLDTAMISYLNSKEFQAHPAKIAIWEIPGYYDFSTQKKFFREAIAAANGSCDKNAIAQTKSVVKDNTLIALEKLASRDVTGSDYYLNINFSAPITEPVTVDLRYIKNRDKFKFDRSKRYPSDGHFHVELNDAKKEKLEKVVLNLPDEAKGKTIDVSLCRKEKNMFGAIEEKNAPARIEKPKAKI